MDELKALSKAAFDWLVKFPAEYWSKSHFRTYVKCDMLTNNMCESLNKTILPARDKPIITMLELIRCLLMRRIHTRRDKMKKWPHKVCPKVFKKIEHRKVLAGALIVEWSGGPKYQVKGPGEQFVVNLEQSMCECRKWQLGGIPCKHAIASIHYMGGMSIDTFVDKMLLTKTYFKAYNNLINPINGEMMWPRTDYPAPVPPSYTRQPGRPRKVRIKDPFEKEDNSTRTTLGKTGAVMTCGHCGQPGHNQRSCHRHLPPKQKPAPKPRGRPRKNPQISAAATPITTSISTSTSARGAVPFSSSSTRPTPSTPYTTHAPLQRNVGRKSSTPSTQASQASTACTSNARKRGRPPKKA
ncbi:hypothetical protein ACLB2K_071335 [Fragaria x ananassa]